ncbi:M6 family metalloprotease domain-containing protein [Aequorivita flava]|uniref:M6 family metalloprotease domain-containing protein n=1 Tax=Aequorivita flava TaxID=3114371 RepID=A0AB35YXF9_9FLAO
MKKITQFAMVIAVICCTWQGSAQGAENSAYYPASSNLQRALPTNPTAGPMGIIPISPTEGNEFCAVTHFPYITEIEQPNGQIFRGRILTDDKITYLETVDGYTVMQDPADKYFKYAAQGVDGELYLSNVIVSATNRRTAQEIRTLNSLNTHARYAGEPLRERIISASESRIPSGVSVQSVFPSSGIRKSLLLLIDYPDQLATYTNAEFNNLSNQVGYSVNGQTGSFRDFYLAASYGNLTINTDVSGWYTAANNRATYGVGSLVARNFLNAVPLIREAVDAAEAAGVNFADYDGDNDNNVDVVMVIHSGRGAEESANADDIWSHRWVLAAAGLQVTYDGKQINDYIIQAEKYGPASITNIGVMCHEFGHALGLPDLYDADGGSEGLGNWCLMAGGTWNNNGRTPAHPSVYCKDEMGWMTPTLLTGSGTINNMDYSQSSAEAYRLNTAVGTEYFLIENRQKFIWDAFLPGSGICIYHIDRATGDNTNPARYRVNLEQADGLNNLNNNVNRGDTGDPYPGSSNNTIFNCVSNPNSKTYNGNESSANVYGIVAQAANKMGFNYFTAADFTALPDISVNAGVQTGLGGGTPVGGAYSGPGVTDDGNGSTYSFDPAAAGVGVHTLTYTFSFAGSCADSASDTVEVLPAGVTFTALADLCINAGVQTGLGGGAPAGGTYSGPGVSDDGNGSTYSFNPTTAGVGTHTLTYTQGASSATDNVEVFALDDASFNYGAGSYCVNAADPTPTITGLAGGTFTSTAGLSINAATGTIDVSTSTPGAYNVTYTTAGTCPNSSSVGVTINALDDASFNYSAGSYCISEPDPTPTITGLGGGTFSAGAGLSLNAATGTIDVSTSTPGAYTVTYTTVGPCPNSSNVGVTINTLDDASFNYSAGSYCINGADPTPTITGVAGGAFSSTAGLSINAATGTIDVSASTPGTYTVTYTTTGACANSSTQNVTINTLDDASFNYSAGSYCVSGADPTPTITGVAGGTFTSTAGLSINAATGTIDVSASTLGTYTVTYTTTGACANSSTQNVTIYASPIVTFTAPSSPVCPNAILTGQGGGTPVGGVYSGPGVTDDGNGTTYTFDAAAAGNGIHTLTYNYTDAGGCSGSATDTVTVDDTTPPTITCPGNISVNNDPGVCGASVTWIAPVGVDNCSGSITTSSHNPGDFFPTGTTTVTYMVTDTNGNTANCSFTVSVIDTEGPVLTCPINFTVSNDPGLCSSVVTYVMPTATDNCALNDILVNGSFETGNFTGWNVIDFTNPFIPYFVGASNNGGGFFPPASPTDGGLLAGNGFDSAGPDTSLLYQEISIPAGATTADLRWDENIDYDLLNFCGGCSDRTYQVQILDATNTVLQVLKTRVLPAGTIDSDNIWVSEFADLSAYAGQTIRIGFWQNTPDTFTGPAKFALDNVTLYTNSSIAVTQTAGLPSGSTFPVGTTTNTFEATDAAGNTSSCSFTITVEDNELPVANCAAPFTIQLDAAGNATIVVGDIENGSTDNCGIATTTIDKSNFSCADVGANTVTLTVTDTSGNISTCTTIVTVEDNVAPTAVCQPFTAQLDATGNVTITGADVDGGSADACGIASLSVSPNAFTCADVGPNTVTLTVTDVNGNVSTCTTTVTVEDNVAPVANCAAPFTLQLDASGNASITVGDINAGSTDACGIASTTIDKSTFTCTDVGPNTVTLTVTDVNGNVSTCTTTVTVEDSIAPTIICPADITANTDAGDCAATVTFVTPVAFDNCGIASVVQTMGDPSGSGFPVGVNTIEFTATDVNGNTSTCSFTITVTDNEPPTMVCQNITIQLDAAGNATITPADVDGGSSDNCGIATSSVSPSTFDCSDVGTNNVTLTVTDVHGNTSTCTAIVTVEDVTAPVAVCQDITVALDASGTVTIAGIDVDGGSTDACGIASYDLDIDTFDCSNVGDNIVTLTVTDVNGNTSTCTATVTVEDNTSPVLVCQDFTLELGADGTAVLDPSDVIASNDDACGIFASAVDITNFSCADIGAPITVQVFTMDVNGNLATCTAQVTVVDLLAPVITCPVDQTVDPGPGNIFYILPDYFATGEAIAIDNCTDPVTITTQSPAAGTPLSDGTYTITFTAEDAYGNVSTCDFELIVESVLGVGENSYDLGSITMYPVPAKNILNIGNPKLLELEKLEIYDLRGRLVQSADLRAMGNVKTINVDQLAAASYYVKIRGTEGEITKRLLKE